MTASKGTPPNQDTNQQTRKRWTPVLFLVGVLVTWFSSILIVSLVQNWSLTILPVKVFLVGVIPAGLIVGIALILAPWHHISAVRRVQKTITAPITWMVIALEAVQILNWALVSFMLLYVIPVVGWKVMELLGWAPVVPEKAYTYAFLVLASVVFTHWGGTITFKTTSKKRREKFPNLFGLLHSKSIRVLIYGLMATAYVAANLEKFSGLTITNAEWWSKYKDVLVEVLLTYAAIDAVLVAWKERNEKE